MKKILVVDDSETLRTQLRKILVGAGYEVLEGENGLHGLQQFTANQDVNLILCDVNMPEMDGLTMCERIASDASLRKPPIFMLTTESSQDMKVRGKAAGIMAWVTKPFVEEKLLKAVDKVCNG
jgi:two-component system chemotaxis response regulator CheY